RTRNAGRFRVCGVVGPGHDVDRHRRRIVPGRIARPRQNRRGGAGGRRCGDPQPGGRALTPRDPHRRRRILDATRALIPRHGIAGITHRLVAAEAGVPVGSTTYYFADLADLTAAALAETTAATRDALTE